MGIGRFYAWTLESRPRFALVQGGINAALVSSIHLLGRLPDLSADHALSFTALGLPLSVAAQTFWYPRAKRKFAARLMHSQPSVVRAPRAEQSK